MFFSGAIYPLPRIEVMEIAGRSIGLYDIIPPTHAVVALNKVLTLGAGLGDVLYELIALLVLSAVYFAVGTWLFHHRHMRVG
jgi:ABC-2 type transport system permease protein